MSKEKIDKTKESVLPAIADELDRTNTKVNGVMANVKSVVVGGAEAIGNTIHTGLVATYTLLDRAILGPVEDDKNSKPKK